LRRPQPKPLPPFQTDLLRDLFCETFFFLSSRALISPLTVSDFFRHLCHSAPDASDDHGGFSIVTLSRFGSFLPTCLCPPKQPVYWLSRARLRSSLLRRPTIPIHSDPESSLFQWRACSATPPSDCSGYPTPSCLPRFTYFSQTPFTRRHFSHAGVRLLADCISRSISSPSDMNVLLLFLSSFFNPFFCLFLPTRNKV